MVKNESPGMQGMEKGGVMPGSRRSGVAPSFFALLGKQSILNYFL